MTPEYEYRQLLDRIKESEIQMEQWRERDRARARQKLAREGPDALSEYEQKLVPEEMFEARQRQKLDAERREAAEAKRQHLRDTLRPKGIHFRLPVLEQFCEHAITLCEFYDIEPINVGLKGRECANLQERKIRVRPISNPQNYAGFLHELGHAVCPQADSRQHRYRVVNNGGIDTLVSIPGEIAAWKFAIENAHLWLAECQQELVLSLMSYLRMATAAEREQLATFVEWANLKVSDHPDPPEALRKTLDTIRSGDGGVLR